ncbi:exonuclease [Bacillus phage Stills]|uniref:Exonuclease n=1 Tax=Bacillus phage Stills TaxID=1610833 RepID=A0A0E3T7P4_9CAUD|nr:exonuclease [Bacillus phage Stills]AKC02695.1 exonuclease [Bacillus phage Stills]
MEYLSSSRIELHEQCPLYFGFKYIEKMDDLDATVDWHADLGSLIHEIMEKIAKREYGVEQAKNHFTNNYAYCYVPEEEHQNLYHLALDGIERKANEISQLNVLDVEMEFTHTIQFGIPPIHGFVDFIYHDGRGIVIRDYKKSKPFEKSALKKKVQPYVYALAVQAKYGEMPYKFEFDFPLYDQQHAFVIDDVFMELAKLKVIGAWNKIKNSTFQAKYSPFFCNAFCTMRSICPVYLKKNS